MGNVKPSTFFMVFCHLRIVVPSGLGTSCTKTSFSPNENTGTSEDLQRVPTLVPQGLVALARPGDEGRANLPGGQGQLDKALALAQRQVIGARPSVQRFGRAANDYDHRAARAGLQKVADGPLGHADVRV